MDEAKKELLWVVVILFILGFFWYYSDEPNQPAAKQGIFLSNQRQFGQEIIPGGISPSQTAYISIDSAISQTDPQKEYIQIKASSSNKNPINISSWTIENKNGEKIKIGGVTNLPVLSQINTESDLYLPAEGTAYVSTGQSPIGTNFRQNKCTGYFSQMQNFYPNLPKKCPDPVKDEFLPSTLDNKCIDYLNTNAKICETMITLPSSLSQECKQYINERLIYNGCTSWHKNDNDFYEDSWRVYLNKSTEMWEGEHGTITLRDQNEKIIDQRQY